MMLQVFPRFFYVWIFCVHSKLLQFPVFTFSRWPHIIKIIIWTTATCSWLYKMEMNHPIIQRTVTLTVSHGSKPNGHIYHKEFHKSHDDSLKSNLIQIREVFYWVQTCNVAITSLSQMQPIERALFICNQSTLTVLRPVKMSSYD